MMVRQGGFDIIPCARKFMATGLCGALACLAGRAAGEAVALPVDAATTINGVELACTGVGQTREEARWRAYPIRVEFSNARNEYLVGGAITLRRGGPGTAQRQLRRAVDPAAASQGSLSGGRPHPGLRRRRPERAVPVTRGRTAASRPSISGRLTRSGPPARRLERIP
jgi:hypothetical protein